MHAESYFCSVCALNYFCVFFHSTYNFAVWFGWLSAEYSTLGSPNLCVVLCFPSMLPIAFFYFSAAQKREQFLN